MLTHPLQEDVECASSTQRLLALEQGERRSAWQHLLEVLADELRWDGRHRALEAHPFLHGCSRQEIRRIARMGDFIEIEAGQLLWRKWQIGYWFLILFSDGVELRDGRGVEMVKAGGVIGAEAILSFGPQSATARTTGTVVAFVIGRRHLLNLADNALLRSRLGLPTDAADYRMELRRWRVDASALWRSVPQVGRTRLKPEHFPANFRLYERDRAQVPLLPAPSPLVRAQSAAVPVPRGVIAGAIAALVAVVVAVLTLYRPPMAVVHPGEAIDVIADIEVDGAPTYPVSGRYLLLSVRFDRPALGGVLMAKLRGERTVSLSSDDTSGVTAYRYSRTAAISHAAAVAGVEIDDLEVRIRDRHLSGPSAGLVYGLALRDMLDAQDHTGGRTIAVTGGLNREGGVYPVWFVREKSGVARRSGAEVFVVPAGQEPAARSSAATVLGVRSIEEALAGLLSTGPS